MMDRFLADFDSSFYELHIKGDSHLVADEYAPGFKRRVSCQAEVFAADLSGRRHGNAGIAPWIFRRRRRTFDGKGYLACDAVDGKVALHCQFSLALDLDIRRLEGQRWELLHIQ